MTNDSLRSAALFGGLGLALGFAHFHGLRQSTRAYLADGVRARTVSLHVARLLGTAAAFLVIARFGALPLLAAFAGFAAARLVTVALSRRPL